MLYYQGEPVIEYLRRQKNFTHINGRTFGVVWFPDGTKDNKVGHVQIRECAEKSLKADTYVLCNCHYLIKLLIDLRVTPALLQQVTGKMNVENVKFDTAMNGPASNVVWSR